MVWLLLIPAFGLLWHFVVVMYIAKSLRNEFGGWQTLPRGTGIHLKHH
jgi:hypothetical protein